jgi:hypothetical protein
VFNPITHQVIRQALSWANLTPRTIQTLLSNAHDDGGQTALYELCFDSRAMKARWLADDMLLRIHFTDFVRRLMQGCFCDDVKVGSIFYRHWDNELYVQIYIELSPADVLLDGELSWLTD